MTVVNLHDREPALDKLFPVDAPAVSESQRKLGEFEEYTADVLTFGRMFGAVALNRYVQNTPDYQSWEAAGSFLTLAAFDFADGLLAKDGRRRQGKDESVRRPLKAYPDHLADKALIDGTTMAIAKREEMNGNSTYASVVRASGIAFIARDSLTTVDRILADIQDIDSRAQKGGKIKMAKQVGVVTLALSPIAKNPIVKAAIATGFVYTAKESISSGVALHKDFSRQRADKHGFGELPLQKWRAKRQAVKERNARWLAIAEDAQARKGKPTSPGSLRLRSV